MNGVQEGYCTKCQHLQVCKYVEQVEVLRKKIESFIEVKEPIEIDITCKWKKMNTGNLR